LLNLYSSDSENIVFTKEGVLCRPFTLHY